MEKLRTAIGGYLELEASQIGKGLHPQAIALNTARNAFEYVIEVHQYECLLNQYELV